MKRLLFTMILAASLAGFVCAQNNVPTAAPPASITNVISAVELPPLPPDAAPVKTSEGVDKFIIKMLESDNAWVKWLAILTSIMGTARLFLKPIMGVVYGLIKATPTTKDDELAEKIVSSKAWSFLVYALDYAFSFKLANPDALSNAKQAKAEAVK